MQAAYSQTPAFPSMDIKQLLATMKTLTNQSMGYPMAKGYDYSPLYPFLTMPVTITLASPS